MGVDIGGTFTDGVLEKGGARWCAKVLTDVVHPEAGIFDVMRILLDQTGCKAADVDLIVHGTTLATNALIERTGARTALITTEGHRDVIEIRDESRFDLYDLNIELPRPLVPRNLRFAVPERMSAAGRALRQLDADALRTVASDCRALSVESIAICFLHSYANDVHERQAQAILNEELPGIRISLSSEVSPQIREYERFLTTCANAYIQPAMDAYLASLEARLAREGFRCPTLLVLSSGALTTIETSRRFPVRLVESGPAGGAIFAANVAAELGVERALAFDMGGTTAKLCLIDDHQPARSGTFEVNRTYQHKAGSGWPIKIPVIDLVEIGAGGGSIAGIDDLGRLTVGPQSAGSTPGPVCYGRGGDMPTVTDANLAVSLLDPDYFAGGSVRLDSLATTQSLKTHLRPLFKQDAQLAALGIREIVSENMAQAARIHAIEKGTTVIGRTMIAFGGCAPLHACQLANKLKIDRVVIPSGAGVGSAIGFLQTDIAYELTRTRRVSTTHPPLDDINRMLEQMAITCHQVVRPALADTAVHEYRQVFMRYVGQGYEITLPIPSRNLQAGDLQSLAVNFESEYSRLYSRSVPNAEIEITAWSVLVSEKSRKTTALERSGSTRSTIGASRRRISTESGAIDAQVRHRSTIAFGEVVAGPALIVEADTTFYLDADFEASKSSGGHLVATRRDRKQGQ